MWDLYKIKNRLNELYITLLTSDQDYYNQLSTGIEPSKIKLDIKCTTCDDVAYNKDIRHINRGQTRCKKCLSKVYSENMTRKNIEWWKDDEYAERTRDRNSSRTGAIHQNYNPNLSDEEREIQRNTLDNTKWRSSVYIRDGYKCIICGDKKGGNLIAHHILNWSKCKNSRYDVNNGITMCEECHKAFHGIYGYNDNNMYQLEEFYKGKLYIVDTKKQIEKISILKNSSPIFGVSHNKRTGNWNARINVYQKEIHLLQSDNFEHCVIIRLLAEKEYLKDAAPQKHLFEEYGINRWSGIDDFKACTQKVRGVHFSATSGKWISKINKKYEKDIYIGSFTDYEDAVIARLNKEYEIYGDNSPQKYFFKRYCIPTA